MSEQQPEGTEPESLELPATGDAAFGQLMDFLVDETDEAAAGQEGASTDAAPAGDGPAAPAGEGEPAAAGTAGEQEDGADGKPAVEGDPKTAGDSDAGGGGDLPPEWTASVTDVQPRFGELSTQLEEKIARGHHTEALEEVKAQYTKYFEALDQHPRMLIGKDVPKIGGDEGETETLRDAADAREWQDAVKQSLVEEVRDRASRALEENSGFLETLHASIEIFQNNADLVPFTKEFDRELADRFTTMMKPYELRVEEKLQGYSIPVQPIINQLRTEITAARATKAASAPPAPKPATNPGQAKDAQGRYTSADAPQAGLQSKAGAGGEAENFDTLFGTLGLSGLRF